jgi:hypothetical protein
MDCHSNLTKWPWYSNVAPISWLVQKDAAWKQRSVRGTLAARKTPAAEGTPQARLQRS